MVIPMVFPLLRSFSHGFFEGGNPSVSPGLSVLHRRPRRPMRRTAVFFCWVNTTWFGENIEEFDVLYGEDGELIQQIAICLCWRCWKKLRFLWGRYWSMWKTMWKIAMVIVMAQIWKQIGNMAGKQWEKSWWSMGELVRNIWETWLSHNWSRHFFDHQWYQLMYL